MLQAIKLARRGVHRPSAEPRIGVLVAAREHVVGKSVPGSRQHVPALVSALEQAGEHSRGASIYSNIEPWADFADSKECIDRLTASQPARLLIGVTGSSSSLARLNGAGFEVVAGILEDRCRELNEAYFKHRLTGLPFVTVKFAQSLDGRLATSAGDSQWISSPASLRFAHRLRREHDCVMVGIGTVLADDPQLTVRLVGGRDPLRVVVDSRLRIPSTARLIRESAHRTLIATTESSDSVRLAELQELGAEVWTAGARALQAGVDLRNLLAMLGQKGIASVLVEGGAGLITSFLAARLADRLVVVVAPKLIGRGIEAVGDLGINSLSDAITLASVKTHKLGPDIVFDARLKPLDT
jgi:diaminohydroxyphosphoribosylaminopyrimidine deaminase/5-amino-6-(5-phosphoribosylamino)uracil reductase